MLNGFEECLEVRLNPLGEIPVGIMLSNPAIGQIPQTINQRVNFGLVSLEKKVDDA